jgi:hypothetical protein
MINLIFHFNMVWDSLFTIYIVNSIAMNMSSGFCIATLLTMEIFGKRYIWKISEKTIIRHFEWI